MKVSALKQTWFLILLIILANMFWGLISIFVVPIFRDHPYSVLVIVFIRFIFGGLIMFTIVVSMIGVHWVRTKRKLPQTTSFFQTGWEDIKHYLLSRNKLFLNVPRLVYIFILAFFGVTLNVSTYFVGMNQLPLVFMLLGAPGGFIILASAYNVVKGKEKLSLFKAIYIFLMILSLILVALAQQKVGTMDPTMVGITALFLNIISVFIYYVYVGRDSYTREETILKKPRTGNYRLMRTMTKLALFMLFGAISAIAIVPVCAILPFKYLNNLASGFIAEFGFFFSGAYLGQLIFLIIACTVLPNLFVFLASMWWDSESAFTFEAWTSILNLIDPITGITTSVIAGLETVDIVFLSLTLIVLTVAILLRFVHERESKINVLIYLKIKQGFLKEALQFLIGLKEIRKFFYITGKADVAIKATFGSVREFYAFLSHVALRKHIKIKYDLISFVEKIVTE
nr:hypothetical protein [Candidatus Sigynarchaeota archaeon]